AIGAILTFVPHLKGDIPIVSPLPFNVGEQLNFKLYLEFIFGGNASMRVEEEEIVDGKSCYRLVSEAQSTPTVDLFYKVRDRIESLRDTHTGFSRRYIKRLREGKWAEDKFVEYKPEMGQVLLTRKPGQQPETLSVSHPVYDILNAFYQVRFQRLEVGRSIFLDVHDIDKTYRLEVKVLRKEEVKVPAGKFKCILIEPMLQSAGIFRREGSMFIWLTDDHRRLPVMMASRLYFGSVWAKLNDFKLAK
ncbi:MAG: DUF3108 domain-containing protein, partial [bacterium]